MKLDTFASGERILEGHRAFRGENASPIVVVSGGDQSCEVTAEFNPSSVSGSHSRVVAVPHLNNFRRSFDLVNMARLNKQGGKLFSNMK